MTKCCTLDDCDKPFVALGYCKKHLTRFRRHGDPTVRLTNSKPGSYDAVHQRLFFRKGRASDHDCVDCGGQAEQWSYDNSDPDELVGRRGRRYSLDLERYSPRCVPCHREFDRARGSVKGETTAP